MPQFTLMWSCLGKHKLISFIATKLWSKERWTHMKRGDTSRDKETNLLFIIVAVNNTYNHFFAPRVTTREENSI